MAFRWLVDDGPLMMVFVSLFSSKKKNVVKIGPLWQIFLVLRMDIVLNSLLTSYGLCRLLLQKSLDPEQATQSVGLDLDRNCLTH